VEARGAQWGPPAPRGEHGRAPRRKQKEILLQALFSPFFPKRDDSRLLCNFGRKSCENDENGGKWRPSAKSETR